jgi:hypothetical protein
MAPSKKEREYKFTLAKLADDSANELKPQRIGSIPKLAVLLGLLSPQFYEVYNLCDGTKDINAISDELKTDPHLMRINIDKLVKSKMISI